MKILMHGFRLVIAGLGLTICQGYANAALLSLDYAQNSGDNWITRDTQSNLDWLDVSLTINQTFDEVRTGLWYQNGFRFATKDEVQTLFLHAGTPDDGFDVSVTYPAESLALAQLLGPTLVTNDRVSVAGFIGTDYLGNQITLQNHPLGETFGAQLGKIDVFMGYGEAHFTGGHPFSDQADSYYGSFLVRATPLPTPSTVASSLVCELKVGQEKTAVGPVRYAESLHFETYNTDPYLSATWQLLFGAVPGTSPHDVVTLQTNQPVVWQAGQLELGGVMSLQVKATKVPGAMKIKIEKAGKQEGTTNFIFGSGGVNPNLAPGGWHTVKIKHMDNVTAILDGTEVTGFVEELEIKLGHADASGMPTVKDFELEMIASTSLVEIKKGTISSLRINVPSTRIPALAGASYDEKIKSGPEETLGHTEAEYDRDSGNPLPAANLSSLADGHNDRLYERKGACQVGGETEGPR
jgi:hypothetical protein